MLFCKGRRVRGLFGGSFLFGFEFVIVVFYRSYGLAEREI